MNLDICWDASKAVIIIKCPKILKVNTSKRFGHVICEQFYFILRYLWITYSFLKKIPYWIFFFFPFHTLDLISLKTKQYKKNIALKICKFQFEGKKLIQLNTNSDTRKKILYVFDIWWNCRFQFKKMENFIFRNFFFNMIISYRENVQNF